MKKGIFISLIAFAVTCSPKLSSAQGAFQNGDNILGVGIGFGSSILSYNQSTPAISVQYEHGNWAVGGPGVISLGGYIGYTSFSNSYNYNYPYTGTYSNTWSYTVIGFRSAYHYNGISSKDWDLYGGAMLSYNILSYHTTFNNANYEYADNYGSELYFTLFIGARYFVSDKVAIFAELGYGIAYFNLGVAFKL